VKKGPRLFEMSRSSWRPRFFLAKSRQLLPLDRRQPGPAMRLVGGDADAEWRVLRGEIMRSRACSTCARSPISLADACADVIFRLMGDRVRFPF
jgi:hypothetical protein